MLLKIRTPRTFPASTELRVVSVSLIGLEVMSVWKNGVSNLKEKDVQCVCDQCNVSLVENVIISVPDPLRIWSCQGGNGGLRIFGFFMDFWIFFGFPDCFWIWKSQNPSAMFSCKSRNFELKFSPYVSLVVLRLHQKFQRERMLSSKVNAIAKNTCISQYGQKIRCFLKIDYLDRRAFVSTETFRIC